MAEGWSVSQAVAGDTGVGSLPRGFVIHATLHSEGNGHHSKGMMEETGLRSEAFRSSRQMAADGSTYV